MKGSRIAPLRRTRGRWLLLALALPTLILGFMAEAASADHSGHQGRKMTDDDMIRVEREWFAKRPIKLGTSPAEFQGTYADTFFAFGFTFDNNNFTLDNPDTAKIFVGETVLWQWLDSSHTVTNGRDSFDPEAGTLFNVPLNGGNPQVLLTFTIPGVYPFFCVIHELEVMTGFVRVSEITGVTPIDEVAGMIGFVSSPAPNPSRGSFTFRFALAKKGRVVGEAFDASGRRLSRVFDRELEPGTFAAVWNGKTSDGIKVQPGAYFLRLRGPGFNDTRKVIVEK
jgi:plastocyanin